MSTVSVPVSELTGVALDWAVAKCEGHVTFYLSRRGFVNSIKSRKGNKSYTEKLCYSSDWSQGGPIIERELIAIEPPRSYQLGTGGLVIINEWVANVKGGSGRLIYQRGPTALVAAMRCRVASKLGSTVDIPAELVI